MLFRSVYRCQGCQRVLFSERNLVEHLESRRTLFERPDGTIRPDEQQCACYNIDIMKWMEEVEDGPFSGNRIGTLKCPCGTRCGAYNWSGAPCGCGFYVATSFSVPFSRVDAQLLSIPKDQFDALEKQAVETKKRRDEYNQLALSGKLPKRKFRKA